MVFTAQTFLFLFFPCCILSLLAAELLEKKGCFGGFFARIRAKDILLTSASLAFYTWACLNDILWLCGFILAVYLFGRLISRTSGKFFFVAAIGLALGNLLYFKYLGFLMELGSGFLRWDVSGPTIAAPLGVSFLTFSAISYLTDIRRGQAPSGSLLDCALYLSFFPKVISGPTILWKDFSRQISGRQTSLDRSVAGINRIMTGFAKKLILADTFGACLSTIPNEFIDPITAWGSAFLYMLQLYYDFSGYSDIAIGLAGLLGFDVKENFDFPYLSRSVSEFWRRWHISLGSWFREYVYFPLGGSRKGLVLTLRNLSIVFLLTGIWHGSGWSYLLWGAMNAAAVVLERLFRDRPCYQRIPNWVKWLATMVFTYFCWQFFRFPDLAETQMWLSIGLDQESFLRIPYTWQYYFDARIVTFAVIGTLGSTLWGLPPVRNWYRKTVQTPWGYALQEVVLLALFVLSLMFMVNSNYKPFIYFQY